MDKFIFIDRDGTIVKDTVYLHKLEDLEFLPGAVDGLREMRVKRVVSKEYIPTRLIVSTQGSYR